MKNFKRRVLSFLSAVALTATLLPSASLFASAAEEETNEVIIASASFTSDKFGSWDNDNNVVEFDLSGYSSAWIEYEVEGSVQINADLIAGDNWHELVDKATGTGRYDFTEDYLDLYSAPSNLVLKTNQYPEVKSIIVKGIKGEVVKYTVATSVAKGCENMGTVTASNEYREGASATIKATPANGYKFVKWVDEAEKEYNTSAVTFNVESNKSFTAYFAERAEGENQRVDTIKKEAERSTFYANNSHKTNSGSTHYGEASSDDYLEFSGECEAYLPLLITDPSVTYEISIRYAAEYEDRNPWVNIWQPGNGSEEVTINGAAYSKASYYKLGVTGVKTFGTHTIKDVKFDEAGLYYIGLYGNAHTAYDYIEVKADSEVFEVVTVVGRPDSKEHGTVTGGGNVILGSDVTLTARQKDGYRFVNWTLDGREVGTDITLIIENVSENRTYIANYEKIKYIIYEAEDFKFLQSENIGKGDRFLIKNDETAVKKKYDDVKFSGGEAVELYKESSAIAIPFTVEEGNKRIDVIVGYDWGTMDETHTDGSDSGLWVNLYIPTDTKDENGRPSISEDRMKKWAGVGWTVDGGSLAANSSFSEGYYVLYQRLDPNETVANITIPANAVPGTYLISVATDAANCDGGTVSEEGYRTEVQNPGAHGYYDYIKFPDIDSSIIAGVNFLYTDIFGNKLMSHEFSKAALEGTTVYFNPKAPRFINVQGYTLAGWEILDADGNKLAEPVMGNDADIISLELEKMPFKAGSTVVFKAIYEIPDDPYTLTVENGRVYVMEDENDIDYSHVLPIGKTYKLANFAQVKLVAPETKDYGTFQYWTLNGMVYSYDRTIFFSAWCDADFKAVYADEEVTVTPAAFISNTVQEFGFETTDVNFHKITFNCAYYIPDSVEFVSAGIIFTPIEANIADLSGVTVSGTTLTNLPAMTALSTARKDQLYADANNQVLMSLTGMKNGVSRYARSFLIYRDANGEYQVVFSEGTAGITTSQAKS